MGVCPPPLLVRDGEVDSSIPCPGSSLPGWLVGLDAPTTLVVDLVKLLIHKEGMDPNSMQLLDVCLDCSATHANAFATFMALLDAGLAPNTIIKSSGCTLLQKALVLSRVCEVEALLRYGARSDQMSAFGRESTSNLQEAVSLDKAASRLAIDFWQRQKKS